MASDLPTNAESSRRQEPGTDRSTAHVGLVCTHAPELKSLTDRLDRRRRYSDGGCRFIGGFLGPTIRVAVVEAGAGFASHRKAAEILVTEHSPAWIISSGFSSSLSDEVRAGDLCLATEIRDTHGQQLRLNCPIPKSTHAILKPHLVTDHHPATSSEKRQLASRYSASAADTVSLAVAQVCEAYGTPCLSIRGVIDDLNEDLPGSVVDALFEPKASELARNPVSRWVNTLRQPGTVKAWMSRAETVTTRLDRFLSGVIRQIGEQLDRE